MAWQAERLVDERLVAELLRQFPELDEGDASIERESLASLERTLAD